MITASDATLAQLSLDAYGDAPVLPPGFTAAPLQLPPDPAARYANGVYHDANGAALAVTGLLDGEQTLVLAFRGSDDCADSISDLQGINAGYPNFQSLIAAADAYAASGAVQQVVVTGHSLGGADVQLYMASHPDQPGGVPHRGETFGSPGAMLAPAPDARIENIVIADDPAVFLGAHRGEIGAVLQADPLLAAAAAQQIAHDLPGLTVQEALASLPFLTSNYTNRGTIVLLPGENGQLGPAAPNGLLEADPAEHRATLYVAETTEAAAGTLASETVPMTHGNAEDAWLRAVYAGDYSSGVSAGNLLQGVLGDLADTHFLLADAQNLFGGTGQQIETGWQHLLAATHGFDLF
ncbi:MAG: hypothetical protein IRY87_06750 [Acetobacteraceae bacterium]|nr:hypothetical protein [Acetobacteraceae bacterium]